MAQHKNTIFIESSCITYLANNAHNFWFL